MIDAIVDMHKKLSNATDGGPAGAAHLDAVKNLVTPHPLGGCNMGTKREERRRRPQGRGLRLSKPVRGDGAIVPEAIGVNPSRTIAALAERAVGLIVSEGR